MSFFIDKKNRRKSPIVLSALGAALLDLAVFGIAYALLTDPLYHAVQLDSEIATTVIHALVIALAGTAVCCLEFLLPDKRVAPYGFAGLAVVFMMFCAAALMLDQPARGNMLWLIAMFGLAPVLVGNAAAWPIYLKMKRANPALNHRKTIQEELREAMEKEAAKKPPRKAPPPPQPEPPVEPVEKEPEVTPEEALFGPEAGTGTPPAFRSAQEEAMLFYEDDEEESDD